MDPKTFQAELFRMIKMAVPGQHDLVATVAGVLQISNDSCYRRLRGDKLLDLAEMITLCQHFKLSLDSLLGLQGNRILFTSNHASPAEYDFLNYMKGLVQNMKFLNSLPERKMYYECKDIPIFYFFHSRELAAFKYFFWHKFLFRQDRSSNAKFDLHNYPDELYALGCQAASLYYGMPSAEFWNIETIQSTLRQLCLYYDTGNFERKEDALLILQKIHELIQDLENICRTGVKNFSFAKDFSQGGGPMETYVNEVLLGSNMILVKLGAGRVVYLNHSVFNYATTTDLDFGLYIENYFKTLADSSTQISCVSETERNIFFRKLFRSIDSCREHIMQ